MPWCRAVPTVIRAQINLFRGDLVDAVRVEELKVTAADVGVVQHLPVGRLLEEALPHQLTQVARAA